MKQRKRNHSHFYKSDDLVKAANIMRTKMDRVRLAKKTKVAYGTFRAVLAGKCPNLKSIRKVAAELGCDVEVRIVPQPGHWLSSARAAIEYSSRQQKATK